ncbi:MAG: iron transporter [Clostridia bacterium]|nr:iron transporter [Clostridia bacterium]
MKNKIIAFICAAALILAFFAGCASNDAAPSDEAALPDGVYTADFDTDSSMFHVNEACGGKGTLTVENGDMTIHISLVSKRIVTLYQGTKEEAANDEAGLIMPTLDEVTYSDGTSEEVYGFDLPVPVLDEEFDCAILGASGDWYDHKVKVSNPEAISGEVSGDALSDGEYTIDVVLDGGSGKASVESPAALFVNEGKAQALIIMSSPHYEYMTLNDTQYDPVNEEGNSAFMIPFEPDGEGNMAVSALTTAMSEPHLIDYTLHFDMSTIKAKGE